MKWLQCCVPVSPEPGEDYIYCTCNATPALQIKMNQKRDRSLFCLRMLHRSLALSICLFRIPFGKCLGNGAVFSPLWPTFLCPGLDNQKRPKQCENLWSLVYVDSFPSQQIIARARQFLSGCLTRFRRARTRTVHTLSHGWLEWCVLKMKTALCCTLLMQMRPGQLPAECFNLNAD